jgi:hypothetical protein
MQYRTGHRIDLVAAFYTRIAFAVLDTVITGTNNPTIVAAFSFSETRLKQGVEASIVVGVLF